MDDNTECDENISLWCSVQSLVVPNNNICMDIIMYRQCIRESVDSLCRDDADMPMPPYIRKACNRPNAAFVSLFR